MLLEEDASKFNTENDSGPETTDEEQSIDDMQNAKTKMLHTYLQGTCKNHHILSVKCLSIHILHVTTTTD